MAEKLPDLSWVRCGQRVRLLVPCGEYPLDAYPAGTTGELVEIEPDHLGVKLDKPTQQLEPWDGVLHLTHEGRAPDLFSEGERWLEPIRHDSVRAAASVMYNALQLAEAFMSGFEGDEAQETLEEDLQAVRDAIALADGEQPEEEAHLHIVMHKGLIHDVYCKSALLLGTSYSVIDLDVEGVADDEPLRRIQLFDHKGPKEFIEHGDGTVQRTNFILLEPAEPEEEEGQVDETPLSAKDIREFNGYLATLTDRQVQGVCDKEKTAGRDGYVALAEAEAAKRGMLLDDNGNHVATMKRR